MIGKVIIFVAVAVSCNTALPFGSCGAWDSPVLGNIVGGPSNPIPSGINLPGPTSVIEGPAFPTNIVPAPASNIIPSGNIITHSISNGIPPFPAPSIPGPTVSGPVVGGIQRFTGPVSFPNIPLGPIVQSSPIQVPNIETRVPTIHTRFPAIQARFPTLEGTIQGFPTVQGTGVFPGPTPPFPC